MRKFIESLNADDYLKQIKLPEASEEDIKFLKLTKELKYLGYTKKRIPHGLGLVFHKHVPVFYGVFKVLFIFAIDILFIYNFSTFVNFCKEKKINV